MTRTAEPSTDPDEDIPRLLADPDRRHSLGQLSVLFSLQQDFRYLLACARLLPHFEPYLTYHHDALWRIFAGTVAGNEKDRASLRDRIVYEEIGPSYLRVVRQLAAGCRFPPRLTHGSSRQRVLFVAHVLRLEDHSPSMEALEFSAALSRQFGVDVMLLDARAFPRERDSDFLGPRWQHTTRQPGFGLLPVAQGGLLTFTATTQGMSTEKIAECVEAALRFNPDYVIAQGHFNLIGDLLAQHFPTICMEMTRAEPISLAHSFILFEDIVRELRLPLTGLVPRAPKVYRLRSHMPLRAKGVTYTRTQFGLSPEQMVYVMVGYHLTSEITDEFEAVMARILDAVPQAVILTVGGRRAYRHPRLKAMPERLPHNNYEPELRSLLALCDCYLNPPRQGGGTSALIALNEELPVLTLPNCDVGGVVGAAHTVADLDALAERAIRIGLDPAARSAAREEARTIMAEAPRFEDTVAELWRALVETREDFEIEQATRETSAS
jgi:hypothetical protein